MAFKFTFNPKEKHDPNRPKTESRRHSWVWVVFGAMFALPGLAVIVMSGVMPMPMLTGEGSWVNSLGAMVLGGIFVAVGGVLMYLGTSSNSVNVRRSTLPVWNPVDAPLGQQTLKLQMGGATGRFILAAFVAVFWNGAIWLGFLQESSTGVRLFLLLFILVGLGILVGAVWAGLALFNPKMTITVQNVPLTLGKRFSIRWQLAGKITRLQHLAIECVGQEQATYQRGTDTYTDTHDFYQQEQRIETTNLRVGQGELRFDIPENSMHTWHSHNNKIVWLLRVKGEIPRWPNMSETYEITVFPPDSL